MLVNLERGPTVPVNPRARSKGVFGGVRICAPNRVYLLVCVLLLTVFWPTTNTSQAIREQSGLMTETANAKAAAEVLEGRNNAAELEVSGREPLGIRTYVNRKLHACQPGMSVSSLYCAHSE